MILEIEWKREKKSKKTKITNYSYITLKMNVFKNKKCRNEQYYKTDIIYLWFIYIYLFWNIFQQKIKTSHFSINWHSM